MLQFFRKTSCQLCPDRFRICLVDPEFHGLCPKCVERVKIELIRLYKLETSGGADDGNSGDAPAREQLQRVGMVSKKPETMQFTERGVDLSDRIIQLMPTEQHVRSIASCNCLSGHNERPFEHSEACLLRAEWVNQLSSIGESVGLADGGGLSDETLAKMVLFIYLARRQAVETK